MPIAVANTGTYIQGGIEAYVVERYPMSDQVKIRLDLYYRRTNTYSGATGPTSLNTNFTVTSHTLSGSNGSFTLAGGQQNVWQYAGITVDQVISAGANGRSINVGWNTYSASQSGYWTGSGSGDIYYTNAPTGISCSNIVPGIDNFTANVSISGWGGEGNSSTRYRELQCWTYSSGLTEPRRYQAVVGDATSGNITVSNSSSGSLNITGNTHYTLGMYASNGTYSTESRRIGGVTTLAPKDTLTANDANSHSLTIGYSVPSDGGYLAKTLSYSIDGGATWVDYATVSGGSATTGAFVIDDLAPNTEYTIQSRVTTSAGTTTNDAIVAKTIGAATPTVTSTGRTYNSTIWEYLTSTYGGGTNGKVSLYIDTNSTPTTLRDTTTDENVVKTFTYTPIAANQIYYARARAQADFDGETIYSDYSETVSRITVPNLPAINAMAVLKYDTADTVTVRANITIPADAGYETKSLYYAYRIGSGSYTPYMVATTFSSGSQQTYDLDISGISVNSEITISIRLTNSSGHAGSVTETITTSDVHKAPTDFDFTLHDNNTALQTWLSSFSGYTNPIYVQGQSQAGISIAEADKGTCYDGTSIYRYRADISVGSSQSAYYTPSSSTTYPIIISFTNPTPSRRSTDSPSNTVAIQGRVIDTLNTYTEIGHTTSSLSWEAPTVKVGGERLPQVGTARIDYSGTYARLQDDALNDGNDINELKVEYHILDLVGNTLKDWTTDTSYTTTIDSEKPFLRNYIGQFKVSDIPIQNACIVEIRASDHFTTVTDIITLEIWEDTQINNPATYDVEIWDWKTNTYIADLSGLMVGSLDIEWVLNDAEQVSFSMDLQQFEKRCREMGVDSQELLKPYAHDIRIRRNGEYILGCQLVEVNVNISNNPPSRITVKGTGFLNLFKDQYILSEAWSGYTYAEIARKLVEAAQKPDPIIKNPTCDIDTSYWLAVNGTIASSENSHSGKRCLVATRSGNGWITTAAPMTIPSDTTFVVDAWVKAQSGCMIQVNQRKYLYGDQRQYLVTTATGDWQHIKIEGVSEYEDGYIIIECNRTDSTTPFYVDDVYIYPVTDETLLNVLNVSLGTDTASATQENTREFNYELQNVKDALMDLTSMEDDNFDFEFLPDRTFNVYDRKGSDKLDLNITFPGNIDSMSITRSAANMANKIIQIGSGIGDERLQIELPNNTSRRIYGTRESVITNSNVNLESTLTGLAIANLYDRKDPTNLPSITIKNGSVNPSNIQTGDTVLVNIEGDDYLSTTTGLYRVSGIKMSLDENSVESMTLSLEELTQRPEKQMVRYIRDSMIKTTADTSCIWEEIQGLMLVGNDYINVAEGATVTGSTSWYNSYYGSNAVDGNINTWAQMQSDGTNRVAITIDLGDEYPLDYIKIWHYWPDGRICYGEHLSVGTTLPDGATGTADLEKVLLKYGDTQQGHHESSDGHMSNWIQEDNIVWGGEES